MENNHDIDKMNERLIWLRKQNGLTQHDVADYLGSLPRLSEIMNRDATAMPSGSLILWHPYIMFRWTILLPERKPGKTPRNCPGKWLNFLPV